MQTNCNSIAENTVYQIFRSAKIRYINQSKINGQSLYFGPLDNSDVEQAIIMGGSQSSEKKDSTSNGSVNNNLTLAPTESKLTYIEIILLVLCGMRIIEMIIYLYVSHLRRMKKKYSGPPNGNGGPNMEI